MGRREYIYVAIGEVVLVPLVPSFFNWLQIFEAMMNSNFDTWILKIGVMA